MTLSDSPREAADVRDIAHIVPGTPPPPRSLVDVLDATVARSPHSALFARRSPSGFVDVRAEEFRSEVTALARGLVAAGVQPGDRVAIMSKTRYEWSVVDFALWAAAAVSVPIYETSSASQVAWILQDAEAVACVVETSGHADRVAEARRTTDGRLPLLRHVWKIDDDGSLPNLNRLAADGADVPDSELARRAEALRPESLATLIYTSGTTGRPKGCMLTHGNFIEECTAAIAMLPELFERDDASTLLFLPLAHVFGRMIEVAMVMKGARLAHSDPARLLKDLEATAPTFILAVPQVFEKVFESARRKATADGKGKIFGIAADTAIAYSQSLDSTGPGLWLRLQHRVFDRLVYGKLRAALGGRADWAISGGAPLGPRLAHFFRGVGVTVLEGYGLTETTAAAAANNRAGTRIGTVGRALPGFELKISETGEVCIRGGHVFTGYWGDEVATAAAVDEDGWFRTGDLGHLDADGFLTITGRSKEIIVTAGGKNVAPAALEDVVRAHPLVAQCLVVGDQRNYVAALITLDDESVPSWLAEQKLPTRPLAELVQDSVVRADVQKAVDAANATVSSAEQIRRFVVLPTSWTETSGHLTPTMKLKRAAVMADFAPQIEELYAPRT